MERETRREAQSLRSSHALRDPGRKRLVLTTARTRSRMILASRIRQEASPILVILGILIALSWCCCAAKAGTDHAGMSARVGIFSSSACFVNAAAAARVAGRAMRKEAGTGAVERRGRRVAVAGHGAAGQERRKPLAMAQASPKGSERWGGGAALGGIFAGRLGLWNAVKHAAVQVGGVARRAASTSSPQVDDGEDLKKKIDAGAAPKAKRVRRSKASADANAPGGEDGGGGGDGASPSASATKPMRKRVATKQGDEQAEAPRAVKAGSDARRASTAAAKSKPKAAGSASKSTVFPLPEVDALHKETVDAAKGGGAETETSSSGKGQGFETCQRGGFRGRSGSGWSRRGCWGSSRGCGRGRCADEQECASEGQGIRHRGWRR